MCSSPRASALRSSRARNSLAAPRQLNSCASVRVMLGVLRWCCDSTSECFALARPSHLSHATHLALRKLRRLHMRRVVDLSRHRLDFAILERLRREARERYIFGSSLVHVPPFSASESRFVAFHVASSVPCALSFGLPRRESTVAPCARGSKISPEEKGRES